MTMLEQSLDASLAKCRQTPVLCLDDEVLVAMDLADMLSDNGFHDVTIVHTLSDAREALTKREFDLALLDVNLGQGETSFEIARAVIASGGRVVFATGYARADLPRDFSHVTVLPKPVHDHDLAGVLAELD